MIIIIPQEFKKAINEMPYNKTVKINSIKIYAALYLKRYLKNSVGYFPVSSQYLQSINKRYYKIMEYFISKGLIDYYKRAVQDDKDIFKTKYTKYYDTERGICTKYRFLVNTEIGDEMLI